jgi:DDE superfamily endonuclease
VDDAMTRGDPRRTPGARRHLRGNRAPDAQTHTLKPWQQEAWCLPSVSAECVWPREDVLDLYAEPYDSQYPVVCFDESPYQLISAVRKPIPATPGHPVRYDDEYRREGSCTLCMFLEPLQGWRHVKVTDRRTSQDVAPWMRDLVDIHFPKAAMISVVLDHLNPHTPAALYATFPPAEAWRIWRKLEFHDTPKPGSWLNMAAIEFAGVSPPCLGRRLWDQEAVRRAVAAWETRRNAAKASIDWRFTTAKARRKLKHLYPL